MCLWGMGAPQLPGLIEAQASQMHEETRKTLERQTKETKMMRSKEKVQT